MIKIHFGNKVIAFHTLDSLPVEQFATYNSLELEIIAKSKLMDEIEVKSKKTTNKQELEALQIEMQTLVAHAILLRSDWLVALAKEPKKAKIVLEETKGIGAQQVMEAAKFIRQNIGTFINWFDQVKSISKFKAQDYTGKQEEFQLFDMANTTLLRDVLATNIASQLEVMNFAFKGNDWAKLASFVAVATRPKQEQKEIALLDSKGFIADKDFNKLNNTDKLTYYNEKLAEIVTKREKVFAKLPLTTAAGILKGYFQKKKKRSAAIKISIPAKEVKGKLNKQSDT